MSILIKKRPQLPKRQQLLCESGGLLNGVGYVGKYDCKNTITVYSMEVMWEGHFPNPFSCASCGGGDRTMDTRCAVLAPGGSHPGVIMITDREYLLKFDVL